MHCLLNLLFLFRCIFNMKPRRHNFPGVLDRQHYQHDSCLHMYAQKKVEFLQHFELVEAAERCLGNNADAVSGDISVIIIVLHTNFTTSKL